MPQDVLDVEVEVLEGDGIVATSEDLHLVETAQIQEATEDGTRLLHLIRPCVGKGRGKHLYTSEMLEANASRFVGWKMYLNHLSDQARRALGGLPRDVRDAGGIVVESYWDPSVPAEGRFGPGAVVGRVKPVKLIQELIDVDSRLVEASINATATAVKPGKLNGERVWIVEGIEDKGSVDWVTEAGAGGKVAEIMEALIEDDDHVETSYLETLNDDKLRSWIERERPDLAEAMKSKAKKPAADADDSTPDTDADEEDVKEMAEDLLRKKQVKTMPQAMAMARNTLKQKQKGKVTEHEEDDLPDVTPEALREAFASDEGESMIRDAVIDAVKGLNLGAEVMSLMEAKLDEDRESIRAEAEARADRRNELRDMRDFAHKRIRESKLAEPLKEQVVARFDLTDGVPTAELNLVSDEDADGNVVKSASQKLAEAIDKAVQDGIELQAKLQPTRVRGQGPRLVEANRGETEGEGKGKGGGGEGKGEEQGPDSIGPTTRGLLEAAGITEPEKAYEHGRKLDALTA